MHPSLTLITDIQHPILRTKAKEVKTFDAELEALINAMIEVMLHPEGQEVQGIGIAAPQVGVSKRIMIVTLNVEEKKKNKITPMINPQILWESPSLVEMEEGCLSIPGVYAPIKRPSKVKVRWQNLKGAWCEKKLEKWDARVFLHEYDHLEGKLFIDYLPEDKRKELLASQANASLFL